MPFRHGKSLQATADHRDARQAQPQGDQPPIECQCSVPIGITRVCMNHGGYRRCCKRSRIIANLQFKQIGMNMIINISRSSLIVRPFQSLPLQVAILLWFDSSPFPSSAPLWQHRPHTSPGPCRRCSCWGSIINLSLLAPINP